MSESAGEFDRAGVDRAWQAFVAQGQSVAGPVRDVIRESWQRCREQGVDPLAECGPACDDAAGSDASIRANDALLVAAAQTWQLLSDSLAATDNVFVVADANGVILDVRGNEELVAAARRRHTGPGRDWSEAASGTNAIGTALVLGRPVIVRSAEHYCAAAKVWDCAAAPIRDLTDGALLGVLDVTSLGDLSHSHTLALAVTAARQIEHSLHAQDLAHSVQLLNWYRASARRWQGRAVLLLDRKARVITSSAAARAVYANPGPAFAVRGAEPSVADDAAIEIIESYAYRMAADGPQAGGASGWAGGVVVIATRDGRGTAARTPGVTRHLTPAVHAAFAQVATRDQGFIELMRRAERMARANSPVLLSGETGSGKELFAQAIHACSAVASGPFVAVNCGTLTRELAASELLGYEAGAFTGASGKGRRGKFEEADGGTLFLDEIGELPLEVQVHLLRVVQDKVVVRVGGNAGRTVDVRIVAATNRDLAAETELGRFRADLYFRLKVFELTLPPLRARHGDIDLLVERFLERMQETYGLGSKTASTDLLDALNRYNWPGNVRELHGLLESLYILSDRPLLTSADLPEGFTRAAAADRGASTVAIPSAKLDRDTVRAAIERQDHNMSAVARELGISRSTLYRKLAEFGLTRD